jgi:DNA-nicking Smr family endonuclease
MSPTDDGDDDRDDDAAAFAEAMRDARPLAPGHGRVTRSPAATARRPPVRAPAASPFVVDQSGDTIAGRAHDVAAKLLRELRGGLHTVDARLDVHGRGRADALRALERFVTAARTRGARGLLVIHGLASSAAERCGVMAFASASARDGGDGATMIWLRRGERR